MTIMGHSAGSVSIAYYSYQYVEDPIVSGFIQISGQPPLIPSDDGASWAQVINGTGCSNSDAAAEVACMQKVAPRDLKRNISSNNMEALTTGIGGGTPVVDNVTFLTLAEYASRGKAGKFAKLVSELCPLTISACLPVIATPSHPRRTRG